MADIVVRDNSRRFVPERFTQRNKLLCRIDKLNLILTAQEFVYCKSDINPNPSVYVPEGQYALANHSQILTTDLDFLQMIPQKERRLR